MEVVGQLSRLVDASLARAPLELETSDEEDAPRLRIGAVVSTKWGPAVVEARRPAADPAQPRRVVCRTFWRARVICEKADICRAPWLAVWKSTSELDSRSSHGEDVASMA